MIGAPQAPPVRQLLLHPLLRQPGVLAEAAERQARRRRQLQPRGAALGPLGRRGGRLHLPALPRVLDGRAQLLQEEGRALVLVAGQVVKPSAANWR